MKIEDPEFFREILVVFREEASQHIKTMLEKATRFEQGIDGGNRESEEIEVFFRSAHSFKGAARTVGLEQLESIGKHIERILGLCKNNQAVLKREDMVQLKGCIQGLGELVQTLDDEGQTAADTLHLNERCAKLEAGLVQEEKETA